MTGSAWAALLPDRSVVSVGGPDRASFLQGLVTNDIGQLAADRALYAGLLTPQGKLLHDFFLIEDGTQILIDVAAAEAAGLVKRLTLYKLRAAVTIAETPFKVAALWGESAVARLRLDPPEGAAAPVAEAHYAFVDPRLAALGVRLVFSGVAPLAALGFQGADAGDYAAHRLGVGIADSAEIAGEICYPLEANFETLHGVDFKKGCYVGQEITARMKHKGGLRKRVLPVTGVSALPAPGAAVTAGETELGTLIAAAGANGLALLRLDRLNEADPAAIRAAGTPLSVRWPNWLPR